MSTSHPLPLHPGSQSCAGSGYCCKQRPCPFGQWNATQTACAFLLPIETHGKHPRYTCGIYEEIVKQPGWEVAPAFGAGCCSPLFNSDREAILAELADSDDPGRDLVRHHREHH